MQARLIISEALFTLMLTCVSAGPAQKAGDPPTAEPTYDVATFRLNTTGSGDTSVNTRLDTLRGSNWSLVEMLQSAFDVQRNLLVGLPDWASQAHYDVNAKISQPDIAQLRAMSPERWHKLLLTLLEERFHLKWHYEMRPLSDYDLVIWKTGPKLTPVPANSKNQGTSLQNTNLTATATPMSSLARILSEQLSKPVVDRTGLAGNFNFHLVWTPDRAPSADKGQDADMAPSLFTALKEQLGLELRSGKDSVQVVVFDAVSQPSLD